MAIRVHYYYYNNSPRYRLDYRVDLGYLPAIGDIVKISSELFFALPGHMSELKRAYSVITFIVTKRTQYVYEGRDPWWIINLDRKK